MQYHFASDAELNAYGYQLLGEKKYTEAIDVLKLNTVKHPENPKLPGTACMGQ